MIRVLALLLGVTAPLVAAPLHEIHSTLTVAKIERGAVELRIRTFADDFSASVAAFHGRVAPADSSVAAGEIDRYVRAHVRLVDRDGRLVRLESCGVERVREVYLLCYRAERLPRGSALRLTQAMLTEMHTDQVNVVQFVTASGKRSTLLTRDAPSIAVPAT